MKYFDMSRGELIAICAVFAVMAFIFYEGLQKFVEQETAKENKLASLTAQVASLKTENDSLKARCEELELAALPAPTHKTFEVTGDVGIETVIICNGDTLRTIDPSTVEFATKGWKVGNNESGAVWMLHWNSTDSTFDKQGKVK